MKLKHFNTFLQLRLLLCEPRCSYQTKPLVIVLPQDPQLAWDKGDYGGLESIRLPPDFVWVPDIVLYNNADGKYEVRACF